MMEKIETFGQFTIYADDAENYFGESETTIYFYNGSDQIGREIYYNVTDKKQAARDYMRRQQDAYLLDDITAACEIVKTNGTDIEAVFRDYKGETAFYFRRYTEDSRYYKQFFKKPVLWMS